MKILNIFLIISCTSLIYCRPSNYHNDKTHKEFYDNKQLKLSVDTMNGNLHGILKYYYSDGKIKSLQHWNNGLPSGDFLFYGENGKVEYHEVFDAENSYSKLISGNKDSLYNFYDETLVNCYSKYLKVLPDTGYYIGINNYIIVKNIPSHLLAFDSNNGIVQRYENKWVAKIKTKERNLIINCYAFSNGHYKKLFTINSKVK